MWEETALRVRNAPEHQAGAVAAGQLAVSAKGVSVWRSLRVEFDVQGTLDPDSGRLRLTKQHKGAFTNSVIYHARVTAAAEAGEGDAAAPAGAELAIVGAYSAQDINGLLLLKRVARALGGGGRGDPRRAPNTRPHRHPLAAPPPMQHSRM